ncbi:MAG TPA: hypothetical protein VGF35_05990 [Steroidobacteraceae bacterium]
MSGVGALRVLALLGLLAATAAGAGEPLYVVEQVIVSVNGSADGSGERIASLKSGERVELIERAGESVHVRLADGKEGWLRAIYLSGDAPLKPRLAQAEAEVTRLQAQVSRLQGQLTAATNARHETQGAAPPPAPAAAEETVPAPEGMFATPAPPAPVRAWAWALGAGCAGLGLGFVLGWRILDRNIRRKYGGLRIY